MRRMSAHGAFAGSMYDSGGNDIIISVKQPVLSEKHSLVRVVLLIGNAGPGADPIRIPAPYMV